MILKSYTVDCFITCNYRPRTSGCVTDTLQQHNLPSLSDWRRQL